MIFNTIWAYLYYMFLFACCGYAILRGARSEYLGATIMIFGSLSTLAVARSFGSSWAKLEVGIFVVDVVALFALIWLSLKSSRFWPLWATAFHLLAVTTHTAMTVAPQITPRALGTGAVFWAYPMLLALAIGSRENKPSLRGCTIRSG
ncbi:hypothetical protein C8024_02790 [Sphingopyxis sp. BSNA05]|uniref:hypothetical protein n=1 Tax=Sphingopyxis sp. BSNA05 TaxID=1236614 RepID=UPI0015660451|nr:hypothetical protein [Sphingopyxis sp. BSNA05]NRD88623.1 hypothetical protein [Sphingopyxis sp. BSNA05]